MGFEQSHPAVNFIFFVSVIAGTVFFLHPVYLGVSFVCALLYSVKRNHGRAVIFDLILIPLVFFFAFYYSTYHHFGMTLLRTNFIGNRVTLESLVYGLVIGFVIAAVIIWMSCVFSVFTTDKVVYLFGKVSPRLSLFLAVLLRLVPRIKREASRINIAQKGIGRGTNQGNLFRRCINWIRIFSMMITWTIGALTTASDSMRARGSSLRGRTAFSIYRFDNRDRSYVIVMFSFITLVVMSVLLHQTVMVYDPRIIWSRPTPLFFAFVIAYACFCLMPLILEVFTERSFRRSRERMTVDPIPDVIRNSREK